MKLILSSLLMLFAVTAHAGPYFRIEPFTEIQSGMFFSPTEANDTVNFGAISPIIRHSASDGYLLIPGISWDLLNIGIIAPTKTKKGTLILGPSINLEEPIKAILRKGVPVLPGGRNPASYGALKRVLAPNDGEQVFLALGPAFGLTTNPWKGHFLLSATLNKRF